MTGHALVLISAVLGHNGEIHLPGQSSSIGVSYSFVSDCVDCYTVYNYGLNYVKLREGDTTTEMAWPYTYLPVAATAIARNKILACADTSVGMKLLILQEDNSEVQLTPQTHNCPDPENMIVFVDPIIQNTPTALDLADGKVYTIDALSELPSCTLHRTFPGMITSDPLMFDGATFYGYAESQNIRCWFYGTQNAESVIECFDGTANEPIFNSGRLNDGHRAATTSFHTGGDIFFEDGCLYLANGDTNSLKIREPRAQFESYTCGKLIQWCNIGLGTSVSRKIIGVGLRHPWTSVSLSDQRRLIADVGHSTREEISVISLAADFEGVANFGWPKFEGNIFRSTTAPYNRNTFDVDIVYTDGHPRRSRVYIIYSVVFGLFAVAVVALVVAQTFEWFQIVALATLVLVGLPQMSSVPGYVGYCNGVYSTHLAKLFDYELDVFPEWWVMCVFLATSGFTLSLGAACASRWLVALGGIAAFVYLVTFLVLLEPPAIITALPVFAFIALAGLAYTVQRSPKTARYLMLNAVNVKNQA